LNTLSSYSMAHVKCNENRDFMIDSQTFVKQRSNVKWPILLDNNIMIGPNKYLEWFSSINSDCIKELYAWSTVSGLNFFQSEKDLYRFIRVKPIKGYFILVLIHCIWYYQKIQKDM
jgi:hypothetical protein